MRWLGMVCVSLSVFLAAPIAVSFVPGESIYCPSYETFPPGRRGDDRRSLCNGALVQDRLIYPEGTMCISRLYVRPSLFDLRWNVTSDRSDICVPVWPLPLAVAALGIFIWHRGARRWRQHSKVRGPSVWMQLTAFGPWNAGIACGSIVILSFASGFSGVLVSDFWTTRVSILTWGCRSGTAFVKFESDLKSPWSMAPQPGPLTMNWTTRGQTWSCCLPVWPVPIVLLCGSGMLIWRYERLLRWSRRTCCSRCGFDMTGLRTGICPECGRVVMVSNCVVPESATQSASSSTAARSP